MSYSRGDAISRVRGSLKSVKEDPFMTDRFIYSLIVKYGKTLIERETRLKNIYKNTNIFKEIPCMDLIEVDKIEACCSALKTGCTFMRTKDKLPDMLENDDGPFIRNVTSLDYSNEVFLIQPSMYTNMAKIPSFKYNKTIYGWFIDGYIFIAGVSWESIRLQLIPDGDISHLQCHTEDEPYECIVSQDLEINIPEYLFSEIENMIRQELLIAVQLPPDGADDSQNALR